MSAPPGALPPISNTVYPAEKWSRNSERRVVTSLIAIGVAPMVARAVVRERIAVGETPDEIEAYLRTTFRIDPTGVTAVRNVMAGVRNGRD